MSNDIRDTLKELIDKALDRLDGWLDGSGRSAEPELIPIPVRNDDDRDSQFRR